MVLESFLNTKQKTKKIVEEKTKIVETKIVEKQLVVETLPRGDPVVEYGVFQNVSGSVYVYDGVQGGGWV